MKVSYLQFLVLIFRYLLLVLSFVLLVRVNEYTCKISGPTEAQKCCISIGKLRRCLNPFAVFYSSVARTEVCFC